MDTTIAETGRINAGQQARLMRLASSALPIGGFSYSQGLESAVELGLVHDEASAADWIEDTLNAVIGYGEAPLWWLLFQAWQRHDYPLIQTWNQWFYASRDTAEARQETLQMAKSLATLANALEWGTRPERQQIIDLPDPCFPTLHAFCIHSAGLPASAGLSAYLYSWSENQVMAAIKTVPLGQTAGQRILDRLIPGFDRLAQSASTAASSIPPAIEALSPQYSIVAARHETQFSRLFRS